MEDPELLAEGFLIARPLVADLQRAVLAAAAQGQPRGHMAEIRCGEGELDDPVGAIDADPLRIVGNARQVQVGHADPPAARQAEGELDAAALVEIGAMIRLGRQLGAHMRQHAMDDGDVMDQRGKESAAECPRARLVQLPAHRLLELGRRLGARLLAQRRRDVVGPGHGQMGDEGLVIGVVDLDGDQLHLFDAVRQKLQRPAEGGVVALHIGDLEHAAGAVPRGGDPVTGLHGERQRLLAHHMEPSLQPRDGKRRVEGIGGGDHQSVELGGQQPLDILMQRFEAVARAHRRAHGRRGIGQGDEGEALPLFPEVEGMLGLPHKPRTDQPHPQPLHHSPCLERWNFMKLNRSRWSKSTGIAGRMERTFHSDVRRLSAVF